MLAVAEKNLTIREALLWAEDYLLRYDVPDANAEAEYLLANILNCKRIELHLNHSSTLSFNEMQRFIDFVERRIKREPSQYITGEQEFWGLAFKVTPDVLIPRPETEMLVEEAVKTIYDLRFTIYDFSFKNRKSKIENPIILDLCTGSGGIAISLAKEIADCMIYAADISERSLIVARENVGRHGVADRIHFLCGDLFEPLKGMDVAFDLIVSNPPYISKNDYYRANGCLPLQAEVRDFEPPIALYGGEDGLDFYRRIISESPAYLATGGYLILEIGYGQAEKIKRLIELSDTFEDINIIKDFSGIDRVIKAKIKG